MRRLINYLRSCFCRHKFELLAETAVYEDSDSKRPYETKRTYMCPKCGYVKKVRL